MSSNETEEQKPRIAWSTLPLIERPLTSVAVVILLALILMGVYFWFDSFYWVIMAGIMLFLSLSAYFVPTCYELHDEHIVIKRFMTTQTKKWADFKRVYRDRNGAFLSPFDCPNRLENFRGVFLRIPKQRDEVFRFLQLRVAGSQAGAAPNAGQSAEKDSDGPGSEG
ncbi:MAG: hypothetical protein JW759_08040 [Candidatus Coatesbacteria bacterium]|nr:hypothetical protein [Candidatus Coatesbacteria bacterium]